MRRALTVWKRRTLLGLGLGVAALTFTVASAPTGNAGTTSPANKQQVEQLGPKYRLDASAPQASSMTAPVRAELLDEFGPKYLLGYELKAAQR